MLYREVVFGVQWLTGFLLFFPKLDTGNGHFPVNFNPSRRVGYCVYRSTASCVLNCSK
jgi:hypothetical protein